VAAKRCDLLEAELKRVYWFSVNVRFEGGTYFGISKAEGPLFDLQARLMIEQSIENVRCLTGCRRNEIKSPPVICFLINP
jgi:hypothetical protein